MGYLQRLYTLLNVLELPDDLMGAVILLLFPILKSLYGSKNVSRPNRDNRVQVNVWDLFLGERVANSNLLKQIFLIEAILYLLGDWINVILYRDYLFNPVLILKGLKSGRDLLNSCDKSLILLNYSFLPTISEALDAPRL
jgi:hypothetical protein